jgi:hypothetical protein
MVPGLYRRSRALSLAAIMRQADAPPKARLQAINIMLVPGLGKAPQPRTRINPRFKSEGVLRWKMHLVWSRLI